MKPELQNIIIQDQRLCILQSLEACNNDANQNILQTCLGEMGHSISIDRVRSHLDWLAEQQLVVADTATVCNVKFYVATITQRGLDVANGRCVVDGVKKPNPKY